MNIHSNPHQILERTRRDGGQQRLSTSVRGDSKHIGRRHEPQFDHDDIADSIKKIVNLFEDNDDEDFIDAEIVENKIEDNKIYIAKTMIEKAESKFENATNEDKEEMISIIKSLKKAIEKNNVEDVEELTDELTDILFYID